MPNVDQILGGDEISPINISAQIRNAALNLLARREHTHLELQQKLARKFTDLTLIDQEIQKLVDQNLLNEQRFTESFVRMRQRQGKGPRHIAQELMQKGLTKKMFVDELSDDKVDWLEIAERTYLKKYGESSVSSITDKMKRQRFLSQKGFTADHIKIVVSKYLKV